MVLEKGPQISTKLGEVVQIRFKTGEYVRGSVAEKTRNGVRLSNAFITEEKPEVADRDDSWVPCMVLIEVPFERVQTMQIVSLGP